MNATLTSINAIISKEFRSELRNRYGITALALFVVTAVSLIVFAIADESVRNPIAAALMWVVMVFTSMTGLGRGFVSEEERGTSLFLRLNASAPNVYFGKLLINTVLATASNLTALLLFVVFVPVAPSWNIASLIVSVVVGSVGLSSVLTIVSAIVAKAGTKNALLPVLSFPVIVPLIMTGVDSVLYAFAGLGLGEVTGNLLFMSSYAGIIIVVAVFVFEMVWQD